MLVTSMISSFLGCIPSKALLHSSQMYYETQTSFKGAGIEVENVSVNWPQMLKNKEGAVDGLTKGIAFLMKKNKVDVFQGVGSIQDQNTVKVVGKDNTTITADNIVIATGSKPTSLPFLPFDEVVSISFHSLGFRKSPLQLVHLNSIPFPKH